MSENINTQPDASTPFDSAQVERGDRIVKITGVGFAVGAAVCGAELIFDLTDTVEPYVAGYLTAVLATGSAFLFAANRR